MEALKLTHYSKSGGCGCKIAPAALQDILRTTHSFSDTNLLIGYEKADDAAVYKLDEKTAIISTTDFFTPIVDDSFDFGRVSACNALSDVYAMGGKPLMALAILGWPVQQLGSEAAAKVLDGARIICQQAGIVLAGGHSIETTEPFFGLAVTGQVALSNIKKNHTIEAEDLVYITKPIGTGILSAALKRGVLADSDYEALVTSMTNLNKAGQFLGELPEVSAITDVTGFGLVGHALEMVADAPLAMVLEKTKIPVLANVDYYQNQFIYPDNTTRNYNAYQDKVSGLCDLDFMLYFDPQTSGGLLYTVKPQAGPEVEKLLENQGVKAYQIGKIVARDIKDKAHLKFL